MTWLVSEDGERAVCLESGIMLQVAECTDGYWLEAVSLHNPETVHGCGVVELRHFESKEAAVKALRDIVRAGSAE